MKLYTTPHGVDEERVVAGRQVRELYPHLQRALQDYPNLQTMFAEPRFERDEVETHWHAQGRDNQGPLTDQSPEIQETAKAAIRAAIGQVKALADETRRSGTSYGQDTADILEAALLIPNNQSIHIVDGSPVVASWGRSRIGEAANNTLLYEISGYSDSEEENPSDLQRPTTHSSEPPLVWAHLDNTNHQVFCMASRHRAVACSGPLELERTGFRHAAVALPGPLRVFEIRIRHMAGKLLRSSTKRR